MSSTNKTTNYNLSQYVGTDKPTYLGDYNEDMSKIDSQMKTNNTLASSGNSRSEINAQNIGTLSNLNTSNKTNLVSAVNEINDNAGNLSSLTTESKTNLVSALNEVNGNVETNTGLINTLGDSVETLEESDVYSSSETVCGTFLDKPLYRKVIQFSFASSDWNSGTRWFQKNTSDIITNISDISYLFIKNVIIKDSNKQQIPAIYGTSTTTNNQYALAWSASSSRMNLSLGTSYSYEDYAGKTITLIIEYTKTAD